MLWNQWHLYGSSQMTDPQAYRRIQKKACKGASLSACVDCNKLDQKNALRTENIPQNCMQPQHVKARAGAGGQASQEPMSTDQTVCILATKNSSAMMWPPPSRVGRSFHAKPCKAYPNLLKSGELLSNLPLINTCKIHEMGYNRLDTQDSQDRLLKKQALR